MDMIFLTEFSNTDIILAILYGLLSLILGIAIGYSINSKFKKQVVEMEREKAKLTSSVSNLEADLEEAKKARSNADGEISLLRNQLRDRESRLKETEGKLAISSRKIEELNKKAVEVPKPSLAEQTTFIESRPIKSQKEVVTVAAEVSAPSSLTLVKEEYPKVSKPKAKKSKSKKDKASKSNDSSKKRGRPAGSKNKSTKGNSETKSSEKSITKKETKKRGRPAGSTNKTTKATSETKAIQKTTENKVAKKRGRPAGSKNKSTASTKSISTVVTKETKKRGRPAGSKNKNTTSSAVKTSEPKRRGRPPGSKNITSKTSTDVKPTANKGKRGRPAGSKNKITTTGSAEKPVVKRRGRPAGSTNKPNTSAGRKRDDLTLIEGIGPKTEEILRNGGIKTYKKMSKTLPATMKKILVKDSARYNRFVTDSWPIQAKLAAEGKMEELKKLQDTLDRGK